MPKVIVTGINGFVGKHLAAELKSRGWLVVGVGREPVATPAAGVTMDEYFACDLTNTDDVAKLPLQGIDAVINLAGLAKVGESFGQAELYNRVNVGVLSVIGERMAALKLKARMIAISTGAVYASNQPMPLTEASALITNGSPYALSKIAMEQEASRLRRLGLNCVVVRPFNHVGPGQTDGFLVPDLYHKITDALKGDFSIKVGSLTTQRDYTDVRDVVKAYADLAQAETLNYDLYNVCSGRPHSGVEILDELKKNIPGADKINPVTEPDLIRPNDPALLVGSNERLTRDTGWKPNIPLGQTIRDFVQSV